MKLFVTESGVPCLPPQQVHLLLLPPSSAIGTSASSTFLYGLTASSAGGYQAHSPSFELLMHPAL